MMKYALLGAAMAMTSPALAQTAAKPAPAAPAATQSAPTTVAPAPVDTAQSGAQTGAPATTAPVDTAQAGATTATAPVETAAQPVTEKAEVAQVVDTEFVTYDKNADGKLSEPEFATWMIALKSKTDPKTDATSPATKKWNQAAFAQADKDKDKSLSKTEVAGFLAPAKS